MKQKTHFKRISCMATLALLMQFCVTDLAAQNFSRSIQRVSVQPAYLEVVTNDGRYLFKPYTKNIIETSFIPAGEQFQQTSHAVVLKPEKSKHSFVLMPSISAISPATWQFISIVRHSRSVIPTKIKP
jgi:hypothetical protein